MNQVETNKAKVSHELSHSENNMQHSGGGGGLPRVEVSADLQKKIESILSVR